MRVQPRFDLAVAVNYYAPYVSGLTEVAKSVAEGLADRGWKVAVIASRHDPALPRRERRAGVELFRCPVAATISRGVVSPSFPVTVARIARASAVTHLHLPMLEAAPIAVLAGSAPLVSTYHIDLWLPDRPVNRAAVQAVNTSARVALRRSAAVVVNSEDQARHSRLWRHLEGPRLHSIPPPCRDRRGGRPSYRDGPGRHVGFLGRIVEDKGLPYLIRAFRTRPEPDARLLIAGDYLTVAGGSVMEQVRGAIGGDPRVRILGLLEGREIDDFYASIDVFALPSVAESFGIAQAEAMMTGVPSVTTDLPGGRYPVSATGFGRLVPPRDPPAIAHAIGELSRLSAEDRAAGGKRARSCFGVEACLDAYEALFASLATREPLLGGPRGGPHHHRTEGKETP